MIKAIYKDNDQPNKIGVLLGITEYNVAMIVRDNPLVCDLGSEGYPKLGYVLCKGRTGDSRGSQDSQGSQNGACEFPEYALLARARLLGRGCEQVAIIPLTAHSIEQIRNQGAFLTSEVSTVQPQVSSLMTMCGYDEAAIKKILSGMSKLDSDTPTQDAPGLGI